MPNNEVVVGEWTAPIRVEITDGVAKLASPVQLPDASDIGVLFDITAHIDPSVMLYVAFDVSEDAGASWRPAGSFNIQGGVYTDMFGNYVANVFFHTGRSEGLYSTDGEKTWNSLVGLSKEEFSALSGRAVPGKRPKVWKNPLVRATCRTIGGGLISGLACVSKLDDATPKKTGDHFSIAFVQEVHGGANPALSSTSGNMNTTTGNLVVANLLYTNNVGFSSFTDNGSSNTWTIAGAERDDTIPDSRGRQVYNDNINGKTGHNFTFTGASSSSYHCFSVFEISGQVVGAALDKTSSNAEGVRQTAHSSGTTATLSQTNEIAVGMGGGSSDYASYTIGASWTSRYNLPFTSAPVTIGIVSGTKNVSSTTGLEFDFTTSVNQYSLGLISTYKEATAFFVLPHIAAPERPDNRRSNLNTSAGMPLTLLATAGASPFQAMVTYAPPRTKWLGADTSFSMPETLRGVIVVAGTTRSYGFIIG